MPVPNGSGALPLVRVGELFRVACGKCHGPEKAEKDLDLTNFANWDQGRLAEYGLKIAARISSRDPEKQMPPPDSQIDPLTAAEMKLVMSVLPIE